MKNEDMRPLRDVLLDKETCKGIAKFAVAQAMSGVENEGFARFYDTIVYGFAESGIERIHSKAESPIEKMFFTALLLACLEDDAIGLLVIPRIDIDLKQPTCYIYGDMPMLLSKYHLCPQAEFYVDNHSNKKSRFDGFLWIPSGGRKSKIFIECDGYEYHSSKESFIHDRQRDRLVQSHGARIVRFSGSEIYADPLAVARGFRDEFMRREVAA